MTRAFTDAPLARAEVDALLDLARRVPSAGHAQGLTWLVLDTPADTDRYWELTLGERRTDFPFPGLLQAPVLVVAVADPMAYVARYAEPDKARTGLGAGPEAWSVPYWFVDAGMAVQTLLLGAEDRGLAACLFGLFEHERAVLDAFGAPRHVRAAGTIALGRGDAPNDRPGRSASRPRRDDVIRRGSW